MVPIGGEGFATLVAGETYYYEVLGGDVAQFASVHFQWDSSIIIPSLLLQDANFPDVPVASAVGGDWIAEIPRCAYISIDPLGSATYALATVSVPGGTAGGCMFNISGLPSKRQRFRLIVGGTGGRARASGWAKAMS
jgi:hypothetical protein